MHSMRQGKGPSGKGLADPLEAGGCSLKGPSNRIPQRRYPWPAGCPLQATCASNAASACSRWMAQQACACLAQKAQSATRRRMAQAAVRPC